MSEHYSGHDPLLGCGVLVVAAFVVGALVVAAVAAVALRTVLATLGLPA